MEAGNERLGQQEAMLVADPRRIHYRIWNCCCFDERRTGKREATVRRIRCKTWRPVHLDARIASRNSCLGLQNKNGELKFLNSPFSILQWSNRR
jgi:hypothetical protein